MDTMVKTAIFNMPAHIRRAVTYPDAATIEYPDFNPCRPQQVIAVVSIPYIMGCKERTYTHCIMDGDKIHH